MQVGHIPRQLAAKLAPFIDASRIHVEGTVAGRKGTYDMPLTLAVYGPTTEPESSLTKTDLRSRGVSVKRSEGMKTREKEAKDRAKREAAERKKATKRVKVKIGKAGGAPTGEGDQEVEIDENGELVGSFASGSRQRQQELLLPQVSWGDIVSGSDVFNPREVSAVVQKFGMGEEDLQKLPAAKQPSNLVTMMLPYQLQGLAWLLQREHPQPPQTAEDVVQLWKRVESNRYQNIATMFTVNGPPELASGGVLADDMGLGKTLQIIALIIADPTRETELVPQPRTMAGCNAGTLIVSPVSVMSNWTMQIAHHVSESAPLKVYTYHGAGRDKVDLSQFDVVVTSYGTLSNEFDPKKKGPYKKGYLPPPPPFPPFLTPFVQSTRVRQTNPRRSLHSLKWRRVVLDEAHQIRNPKAKSSRAATNLNALSRWALTGTPIINSLKDLYSQLRFLRFSGGLSELDIFNRVLMRPLNRGEPTANICLQALMASLCLRRTKDMKFVDLKLPSLTEYVHKIDFWPEEKKKYDLLDKEARGMLEELKAKSAQQGPKDQFRFLLEILLRMRQMCNHHSLCGERLQGLMKLAGQSRVELTEENIRLLQDLLQLAVDSQEDCAVCLEPLHNPRITICKHIFGQECIERVIEVQHKCPMCRCALASAETTLVEPAPPLLIPEDPPLENSDSGAPEGSSKISALLTILNATRSKDSTVKTIIFSQWTSYLDIISAHLSAASIQHARIDGTMPPRLRDNALTSLSTDPNCTVLLASLAVASVGLNLVAASQVVLMDSWWAPAIEDQAVDRVHRLGQTKETTVFRLVVKGSVEERVLGVQERKRQLVETAFGEGAGGKRGHGRLGDVAALLG